MIQILITGGTIDKHYDESGELTFKETKIPGILEQGRYNQAYQFQYILLKDSLDMTEMERRLIMNVCLETPANKILITHGTDTMIETAKYIAKQQPDLLKQKAIVFVGAMVPKVVENSDADFNIGFALGSLSLIRSGAYIAMGGKVFPWNKVHKNREKMVFEVKK